MKKVIILLAEGFEEIEAVTPIDILRRAGVEVVVAGLDKREITSQGGVKIVSDIELKDVTGVPDMVILPGGSRGASNLSESALVKNFLIKMKENNKAIAAICAAPAMVLARHGFLDGKKATCYPGFEKNFSDKITFSPDRVVEDGDIITSRGPGTAMEFSLALVRRLVDTETADTILEKTLAKV